MRSIKRISNIRNLAWREVLQPMSNTVVKASRCAFAEIVSEIVDNIAP
jgi:hypothetical protein